MIKLVPVIMIVETNNGKNKIGERRLLNPERAKRWVEISKIAKYEKPEFKGGLK